MVRVGTVAPERLDEPDRIAEFLARFQPFSDLPDDRVAGVARDVVAVSYAGGEAILRQGADAAQGLFVVRTGIVDLLDDERPVDHLDEGEIFGISVLSGLGPALSARARGETWCYLIPPARARDVLGTPEGLAYLARSVSRWRERGTVERHLLRSGVSGELGAAIRGAGDAAGVVGASRGLPETMRALFEDGVDPVDIGHVVGSTIDELTRRLIELFQMRAGAPPGSFAWLALGSAARHEQALGTDQDHAIAYGCDEADVAAVDPYFADMAGSVTDGLEACGIARCRGNVMAENPAWRRTVEGWRRRFGQYVTDRDLMAARITGIAFDYRRVTGTLDIEPTLDGVIRSAGNDRAFLGRMAATALEYRPPVGRVRDIVVERSGDHAGLLDIKHGGITIVTNLARVQAIAGGLTLNRTIERLHGAASIGSIADEVRADLEDAFRFLWGLRIAHHLDQVDRREPVDDFIDPSGLRPIAHRTLAAALHVIADAVAELEKHGPGNGPGRGS
jgi:signal-transduction protein with cAMP-binding, CBS, and nucleotidyltransferase domain